MKGSFHHILLTLLLYVCCQQQLSAQKNDRFGLPATKNKFIVVAHRGDHTKAPENTLQAFENAIKAGADYIEIDLRTTKDSQLVIMHDASVNRTTNATGMLRDFSWNELKALQVLDKNHPEWGKFKIPSFEETLKLSKDKINIYLDFKEADVLTTWKLIKDYKMEKQVIVYINNKSQFMQWRSIAPIAPLIVSLPDEITSVDSLNHFIKTNKIKILDGGYEQYTKELIDAANRVSAAVIPDIQGPDERPELWNKAMQKGVQGLQTDHPEALINYLKSINKR